MSREEKQLLKGKIIDVMSLELTLPGGAEVVLDKVAHPGAALIVPFYRDRICLVEQYRAVVDEYLWECPAGKLSPGEEPRVCAVRELEEETGLIADEVSDLGHIYTSPGFADEKIFIYKAHCNRREPTAHEADEVIEVHFLTNEEIRAMFSEGRITDAKTISALALAGTL